MSKVKINERILEGIRENSDKDEIIESFLIDLILEEAYHPGQWWWKDTYRKRVDNFSASWEDIDAN